MLGLGLGLNRNALAQRAQLVRSAGCVLYLDARRATGSALPVNSPLTSPWIDLSGQGNNATPTNMAGTITSGVNITDPSKPFWVLDGIDDFFSLVNTASVDITSAPLAVFATIKVNASAAANSYIVCKNITNASYVQYGISWSFSGNQVAVTLEGAPRGSSAIGSVPKDTWKSIGFIWNGANINYYINGLTSGTVGAYSGILTSRAYLEIGRREVETSYFSGSIATVSIYSGSKATETNILKAEKAISAAYLA